MSRYKLQPHLDENRKPGPRWRLDVPASISDSGRRERYFYVKHSDALAAADKLKRKYHYFGRSLHWFSIERMNDAAQAYAALEEAGIKQSLHSIVKEWIAQQQERSQSVAVTQLFAEYILARKHRTAAYLARINQTARLFSQAGLACDLSSDQIALMLAPLTRTMHNHHLRNIRSVMNWGIKKGYLKKNPVSALEFIPLERKPIEILSPDALTKMLTDARANRPKLLPILVLGAFGGVRLNEIRQLKWGDIRLDGEESQVTIRADVSKTRRKRYIPLSDNAVKWLRLVQTYTNTSANRRVCQLTRDELAVARQLNWKSTGAETNWPQNALRHSYGSYLSASLRDLSEVALRMGHTSTEIGFKHYIDGTTKKLADQYFNIYPS